MQKEFLQYSNDNIIVSDNGEYLDEYNNDIVLPKLNYEDEGEATLDFTIYEPTVSELKNYNYKDLNERFSHQKRVYLDDFTFDDSAFDEEEFSEEIIRPQKERDEFIITKTSNPINTPLRFVLFILKVVLLFILCVLIFSISRYNYLQEKNGDNTITFENFIENVRDTTVDLKDEMIDFD